MAGASDGQSSARLFSLRAAAVYLGVSYWTLRDLVIAGTIPRVRLGAGRAGDLRRILVDRRDLDEMIEKSKEHDL